MIGLTAAIMLAWGRHRVTVLEVQRLHVGAQSRGWDSKAPWHARVADALADRISRFER